MAFGRFRLARARKLLLEGDKPVRLGGRALDLLIALVERAGEVVSRQELEARVWPRTFVEETSLRVHVSALRKALGDGHDGARFITNIPGRGYCFIAPVVKARVLQISSQPAAVERSNNLPARLTHVIGRDGDVETLRAMLSAHRFVTIIGPGGMGKTTVALSVAEDVVASFRNGVWFIDLSSITEPSRLVTVLASTLQVAVPPEHPFPALTAALRDQSLLVVLDTCEHLIGEAAGVIEALLKACPHVSVLATSRERLDAEGEWVHRLESLAVPPESEHLSAAEAMTFAGVQLFVQRALAKLDAFELSDTDAPEVADVCRQLDGLPLAIEFAAACVDALGVRGLRAGLQDRLRVLVTGRRTAVARHRTLRAMLDWSYELLSPNERAVLARLSVFKAPFSLESAQAVACDAEISAAEVVLAVMQLAAKSLLCTDLGGEVIRYRLLDTTRAYADERLLERGDAAATFARHARQMNALMTRAERDRDTMPREQWFETYCQSMEDVWAALEWSFSEVGERSTGVSLAAEALLPVYELGLLDEHHPWIERALSHVPALSPAQPLVEMRLSAALIFPGGRLLREGNPSTLVVERMQQLAQQLGEPRYQVAALYSLWGKDFRAGDYVPALSTAIQMTQIADETGDAAAVRLATRLLAQSRHFMGEHGNARALAEKLLRQPGVRMPPDYMSPVPYAVALRIVLARILWLQGFADQAVAVARECTEHAATHPFALTQALALAACPIALWTGDDLAARVLVDRLTEHCARHPSAYWQTWGQSYEAVLSLRDGGAGAGRVGASDLAARIRTRNVMELDCVSTMTEELLGEATVGRVRRGQVGWCAPEILRVFAENLSQRHGGDALGPDPETVYVSSLDLARQQGALAWELRSAMSLARLWRDRQRVAEARDLLSSTVDRFREGFGTADLRAASTLIADLGT